MNEFVVAIKYKYSLTEIETTLYIIYIDLSNAYSYFRYPYAVVCSLNQISPFERFF